MKRMKGRVWYNQQAHSHNKNKLNNAWKTTDENQITVREDN